MAQTGQWKLQNIIRKRRADKVHFDAEEFDEDLNRRQNFKLYAKARLQILEQTAFHLAYEDLQNQAVIDGLAYFRAAMGRLKNGPQNGHPKTQPHCFKKRLRILLTCSMHWLKLVCLI